MALPASFLNQVEHHSCFSGCYGSELDARVCLDPALPPEPAVFISCRDCLTYKAGVLRSLLAPGTSSDLLADQVTQHMRGLRGFHLSFGGYHMRGGGFWLNAVYYERCGIFLVDGARSRATGSDLDLLLLAFRQGVIQPPDPAMTDPQHYATQVIYVDFSVPVQPVTAKADLLSSAQCRLHPTTGYHRVTLAEFLPVATRVQQPAAVPVPPLAAAAVATAPPAPAAPQQAAPPPAQQTITPPRRPGKLRVGDVCPVCHEELRERPLFTGTYIGCLC